MPHTHRNKLVALSPAAPKEGHDAPDPFKAIGDVLRDLRDPDANGPEVVAAAKDPQIDADMVVVKEANEDYKEAASLPKKLETAQRLLRDRQKKGDNLGFEPGDLPSHA